MSTHLTVVAPALPVAQARCGALVMDHGAQPVDGRWHATDESERTALAHLRGWVHFGPRCPICAESRRAAQHTRSCDIYNGQPCDCGLIPSHHGTPTANEGA